MLFSKKKKDCCNVEIKEVEENTSVKCCESKEQSCC